MWAGDAEDSSPNLGWQPRWFARTSVPMVAWAFSFSQQRVHEAGQTWLLEHHLALLDLGEGEDFDPERLGRIWGAQHRALDGFGS